jgi:hypothetical protein
VSDCQYLYIITYVISDSPVLLWDDEGSMAYPVDPLTWWMEQRQFGKEMGGLTQLALDIYSLPGKLSKPVSIHFVLVLIILLLATVSDLTFKSHSSIRSESISGPFCIREMATLGAYSMSGLVRPSLLRKAVRSRKRS